MDLNRLADWLGVANGPDSRVKDWPLLASWEVPACLTVLYVVGIPLGQRCMRNRRPVSNMLPIVALHNLGLFMLSVFMCLECIKASYDNFGWKRGVRLWCNPNESGPGFSKSGYRLARVLWIHYLSKAWEFGDTLIMILKRNDRQITFLHVYHHATTFFPVWWAVVRYGPSGEAYFTCALNSGIHIFMYGYYLWAALGVRFGAAKMMITLAQIIQFVCLITQSLWMLGHNCYQPRLSPVMLLIQCSIFLVLFIHFAKVAYFDKPRAAKRKSA